MTRARKELIAVEDTPYYHCISRCVRRAYLCGDDFQAQKNFDHRKRWLIDRFQFLASVFAIDVCAYAVMSNHYHLVLFINQAEEAGWSDEEVLERWATLFPTSTEKIKNLILFDSSDAAQKAYQDKLQECRANLSDISWFMRCLNEHIARRANEEDDCKGRFWEGRFKSQALLDEKALLTCMAYVDLNPIRAKMADSPETSDFTSLQERLYHYAQGQKQSSKTQKQLIKRYEKNLESQKEKDKPAKTSLQTQQNKHNKQTKALKPAQLKTLHGSRRIPLSQGIPYSAQDYFELVDWSGRILRADKRGAIDENLPPLLKRLGIEPENWLESVMKFQQHFFQAAGSVTAMEEYRNRQNQRQENQGGKEKAQWLKGKRAALRLFA